MVGRIICLGNDALLLETRCWILERQFRVFGANGLPGLSALLEENRFDLIVLCHTLSSEECERATSLLRDNSPDAKVITMLGASQHPLPLIIENRIDPMDGPRALLDRIHQLL